MLYISPHRTPVWMFFTSNRPDRIDLCDERQVTERNRIFVNFHKKCEHFTKKYKKSIDKIFFILRGKSIFKLKNTKKSIKIISISTQLSVYYSCKSGSSNMNLTGRTLKSLHTQNGIYQSNKLA